MIKIKNLVKRFGDRAVLDGIDIAIPEGKITVIMGGSGCGKSTLLRHLIGLHQPTSGEVWVDGRNIAGLDEKGMNEVRKKFGMLFQGSALFNSMTVGQNVAVPLKEHTDLSPEIIKIIVRVKLELVGLTGFENFMPHEISGGMKKRVALARAIALDPKIVFYDEPGAGLDPITASMIDRLILDLSKKLSITSVVVTHEMKSAFRIADQIVILQKGKVIQVGTAEEIQNSKNAYVRQFIQGESEGAIPFKQTSEAYLKGLLDT
ncbi:MAG TPA: ABC transporter ATP-binding protein [Candidatus Omnitrophota bacterium]|nr:ABC transporter ATP-binding protein [Candidatus Omnitrophota bacterium]HQB11750.1 ABC transporter ATP-binding protein [Candidatus Omnitrophota bacterium]